MGWLGKIIGGGIGFAIGGPIGAAVGVGLGHGVDVLGAGQGTGPGAPEEPGRLGVRAQVREDELGFGVRFELDGSPIPGSLGVVHVLAATGTPIAGHAPFADAEGYFTAAAPLADGGYAFYLPYGAIGHRGAGAYGLSFSLLAPRPGGARDLAGSTVFEVALPAPRRWSKVEWLAPLVVLAMAVARADGRVSGEEVRLVKEYFVSVFELGGPELEELQRAMKAAADAELAALVASVAFRLPAMPHTELLAVLADVAKCDGEIHAGELRVIREVALAVGADPGAWEAIAAELGLGGDPRPRREALSGAPSRDPHEVLGIGRGASTAEIQAAYRKLVSDYHPDRVANLPREFQEVAHNKMTEINAAYAELRRAREAGR